MQIRVITLRYAEGCQGFPEDAVKKATFGRELLSVSEHFFVYGNVPHLTLVLSLGDAPFNDVGERYKGGRVNVPDPAEDLDDAQKAVYRALKVWRNEKAKEEARPAYAIARNVQLAELVRSRPSSLAAIKEIEGFGGAFCERYGKEVLSLIGESPTEAFVQKEMPL